MKTGLYDGVMKRIRFRLFADYCLPSKVLLHPLSALKLLLELCRFLQFQKLFQSGEQALKLSLEDECESAEKNDLNSWKSALYRGLINNFDKVKSYITQL